MPWDRELSVPGGVLFREVDGEAVLLELAAGTYFGLDRVGTRIWELVTLHRRLDAVHRALCAEFAAPAEVLARDLSDFVGRLLAARLLEVDAP